jgi:hypothetical protein
MSCVLCGTIQQDKDLNDLRIKAKDYAKKTNETIIIFKTPEGYYYSTAEEYYKHFNGQFWEVITPQGL